MELGASVLPRTPARRWTERVPHQCARNARYQRGRIITPKATHSIYFEVLSETGFTGFAIWSMIIVLFYLNMYRLWKKTKGIEELEWLRYLLNTLITSMTVFLVGGAFLSIAFIPLFYYVLVLGLCLCEHHRVWQMDRQSQRSLYLESPSVRAPRRSAPA